MFDHFGKAFVDGNVVEGYPEVSKDNWKGGVQPDSKASVESVLPTIRLEKPYTHAELPMQSAEEAYQVVLREAGATLPKRDAVDLRVIEMVKTGKVPATKASAQSIERSKAVGYAEKYVQEMIDGVALGFITEPSEVGGYPEYRGIPYLDSDGDGMSDGWEEKNGLNPKAMTMSIATKMGMDIPISKRFSTACSLSRSGQNRIPVEMQGKNHANSWVRFQSTNQSPTSSGSQKNNKKEPRHSSPNRK